MKNITLYANNFGRMVIHPWKLAARRGNRGPKTFFKYIAFYWAAWWASLASVFGFIV